MPRSVVLEYGTAQPLGLEALATTHKRVANIPYKRVHAKQTTTVRMQSPRTGVL